MGPKRSDTTEQLSLQYFSREGDGGPLREAEYPGGSVFLEIPD